MGSTHKAAILIGTAVAVLGAGRALPVRADTVVVNDQVTVRKSDIVRPARGITMAVVETKFGAPQSKHAAVGTPPITRWDYPSFSVFFEKDRVIDAVVPPPASELAAAAASSGTTGSGSADESSSPATARARAGAPASSGERPATEPSPEATATTSIAVTPISASPAPAPTAPASGTP